MSRLPRMGVGPSANRWRWEREHPRGGCWPPAAAATLGRMEPGRRWRPDWRDAALALGSAAAPRAGCAAWEGGRDRPRCVRVPAARGCLAGPRPAVPCAGGGARRWCWRACSATSCVTTPRSRPSRCWSRCTPRCGTVTACAMVAVSGSAVLVGMLTADPAAGETMRDVIERRLPLGSIVARASPPRCRGSGRPRSGRPRSGRPKPSALGRRRPGGGPATSGCNRPGAARLAHHSISVIKVQAGVAVHLARKRGEEVPEALLAIQEASRDATRELRATLDVLRTAEADAEATTRRPAGSTGWTSWSSALGPQASPPPSASAATSGRCRRRSIGPRTGSSRRR